MNEEEKLESYARVYAEVDLDAVHFNMEQMKSCIPEGVRMLGVIKTDGYGHGSVPIARELSQLDYVYGFATATFEEARILQESGIQRPILILGYTFPYCYREMIQREIRPVVFRLDMARELSKQAVLLGKEAIIHIKVDCGMSRIGILPDTEGLQFIREVMSLPMIRIEGIFTHFARADEADTADAVQKLESFQTFCRRIKEKLGLDIPIRHCANSAALIRIREASMDMVRAGISIYGLWPSAEMGTDMIELHPALSLKSRIVYIKEMKNGMEISYGGTFTATEGMRVATIPVGYGDGYPRSLSNRGYVLIHGRRARILGRVCMDQMMVDVTDIPEAQEGDVVTLIGTDGRERLSAEYLGELSGRFNYELVCDLGKRIPRVYKKGGRIIDTKDYYEDFEYLPEKGQ